MFWESYLPNSLAGAAQAVAAQPAMDDEVFAGFYERSSRAIWAYLARTSGDAALAEDLTQEAYIRFLTAPNPPSYARDGEVACRRYLFRIATNLMRDHWRRPSATSIEDVAETWFSQPDTSAQSESRMMLGPALARLRPRDRQLLWLAHAEGYSHHEIAEVTGLGSASIRLLLFRARRKLARMLSAGGQRKGAAC